MNEAIPNQVIALAGSAILHWNSDDQQTVADIFDEVAKQNKPFEFLCAVLQFTREIMDAAGSEELHELIRAYLMEIAAEDGH